MLSDFAGLQTAKIATLGELSKQTKAVEETFKTLLEATRTLAEDINFDVLIGVATSTDATKDKLSQSQQATTAGMAKLSTDSVNGLQTLKAALMARGHALKLSALVRDVQLASNETRLKYLREDFKVLLTPLNKNSRNSRA